MATCVVTMVYNEGDNIRRWFEYYAKEFGAKNLIVLDNGSDDNSVERLPVECGRLLLPRTGGFSNKVRARFVSNLISNLLKYYDTAIYTDCDEFLIADPRKYPSLSNYLEINKDRFFTAIGLNVFQLDLGDKELDPAKPILKQRPHCHFASAMCKPVVTRSNILWGVGFHSCNLGVNVSKDLYLVHTKNADLRMRLKRQAVTRLISENESPLDGSGPGRHQRLSDEEVMDIFKAFYRKPPRDFDRLVTEASRFIENNIVKRRVAASSTTLYGVQQQGPNPGRYRTRLPDAFLDLV